MFWEVRLLSSSVSGKGMKVSLPTIWKEQWEMFIASITFLETVLGFFYSNFIRKENLKKKSLGISYIWNKMTNFPFNSIITWCFTTFPVNHSISCDREICWLACFRHLIRLSWTQHTLNFNAYTTDHYCLHYYFACLAGRHEFIYFHKKFDGFSIIFLHPVRKLTNPLRVILVSTYHF